MAIKKTDDQWYHDIASAIREQKGEPDSIKYTPNQMAAGVREISSGSTDGQFFPMTGVELMPTITVTYNGNEV